MQVLPLRDVLVSDSRLCTGIIFTRQGEQDVKEEEARKQKVTPPTHLQIPFNFFVSFQGARFVSFQGARPARQSKRDPYAS